MAARIEDRFLSAEYDGRVIVTARHCKHVTDDGRGPWAVRARGVPLDVAPGDDVTHRWDSDRSFYLILTRPL